MTRWILLLFCLLLCNGSRLNAQVSPIYRQVVIPTWVKDQMAQVWDDTNPNQTERAYCGKYHTENDQGMLDYMVDAVIPADSVSFATPYSIHFVCARPYVPIHVHTPTTCDSNRSYIYTNCRLGGPGAYICEPSPLDRLDLIKEARPFAIVQCDKRSLVPYYPENVNSNQTPNGMKRMK